MAERTAGLVEANHELERFAHIASHDLRAPLRPLLVVPEWIRETLTARYVEAADDVEIDLRELEVQGSRLDALLTDLLTYSRIGRTSDAIETVGLLTIIAESIALSGLPESFSVNLPGHLPMIRCVPAEFARLIRNLVSNAVKHHDRPAGAITIGGAIIDGSLHLTVADDGPGIEAKYADRIFEMFSTLRTRDEVEGSGMGLAMVRKAMDHLGGTVVPRTHTDGRGAVLVLTFPQDALKAAA